MSSSPWTIISAVPESELHKQVLTSPLGLTAEIELLLTPPSVVNRQTSKTLFRLTAQCPQ